MTVTLPLPSPMPVWPQPAPSPGVGTPAPSPTIGVPIPGLTSPSSGGSIVGPFADLFKFPNVNWGWWLAVIIILITVQLVENYAPEYVWGYVAILLLGFMVTRPTFGSAFKALIGGK